MRRYGYWLFPLFLAGLTSCRPDRDASAGQAGWHAAGFLCEETDAAQYALFLAMDEMKIKLANLGDCRLLAPALYADYSIPDSAGTAAVDLSQEDWAAFFLVQRHDQTRVYRIFETGSDPQLYAGWEKGKFYFASPDQ